MGPRFTPRLTYANVISSIALFVVLGGGAYATIDRKIGTKDLRKGAVSTPKLKKQAVGTGKLKDGAVTASKLADGVAVPGPPGPEGAQGPQGPQGAQGPAGSVPVSSSTAAGTVATTSGVIVPLAGGPSVTVNAGSNGGFVQLFGRGEINTGTDAATRCDVYVTSASLANPVLVMIGQNNAADEFEDSFNSNVPSRPVGPGQHTFTFGYQRLAGTTTCSFRNRTLMAAVFAG